MQSLQHVEIINNEAENIFDGFGDLFQIESIDGEFVYVMKVWTLNLILKNIYTKIIKILSLI